MEFAFLPLHELLVRRPQYGVGSKIYVRTVLPSSIPLPEAVILMRSGVRIDVLTQQARLPQPSILFVRHRRTQEPFPFFNVRNGYID